MVKKRTVKAPEDIVNAMFAEPDPLLDDAAIHEATKFYNKSNARIGIPHPKATRTKISNALTGRKLPEERVANMKGKGNPHSEATRKKMSETRKGVPYAPGRVPVTYWKGKTRSEKTILRMQEGGRNRIYTKEVKAAASKLLTMIVTCPHCGKQGARGPFLRWHFNNCELNLAPTNNRKAQLEKLKALSEKARSLKLECPHCGKSGTKGPMLQSHFDNCKHNPNKEQS